MPNSWVIRGPMSYEQRIKLAASELIEAFQPDGRRTETRFWPGSPGVYTYLKANLPPNCTIEGEELQAKEEKRMPAVVHRTMEISDD